MITIEKALQIAIEYVKKNNWRFLEFAPVDKVYLEKDAEITYPGSPYYRQKKDVYVVYYDYEGGMDIESNFVHIDSRTGEVLFTLTSHWYMED